MTTLLRPIRNNNPVSFLAPRSDRHCVQSPPQIGSQHNFSACSISTSPLILSVSQALLYYPKGIMRSNKQVAHTAPTVDVTEKAPAKGSTFSIIACSIYADPASTYRSRNMTRVRCGTLATVAGWCIKSAAFSLLQWLIWLFSFAAFSNS